MILFKRRGMVRRVGIVSFGAMLLAGCGRPDAPKSQPVPPASSATPAAVAVPGRSPRERYTAGLEALQQGNVAMARAELAALLQDRPGDVRAVLLLRQIDTDPKQLFGGDRFSYTVRAGDTLFSLARKYLHNPLNFYGLARFNDLTLPVQLQPGQQILIPGRVREPEHAPVAARRAAAPMPAPPPSPINAEPAPVDTGKARRDAQRLRQQGLEQLSAGSIDRAVNLLSQAAGLSPGDSAIANDLARARRIQATVRSK